MLVRNYGTCSITVPLLLRPHKVVDRVGYLGKDGFGAFTAEIGRHTGRAPKFIWGWGVQGSGGRVCSQRPCGAGRRWERSSSQNIALSIGLEQ
ncbi:hypothetical protein NKDENANG_02466 [Candidatus Entotheonellaceae bacterium PAL068K]